jgi:hypothetical protein
MPIARLKKCNCFHPLFIFALILVIIILFVYCCNSNKSSELDLSFTPFMNLLKYSNKSTTSPSTTQKEGFGIGVGEDSPPFEQIMQRGDLLTRDVPIMRQQDPSINRTSYEINSLDRIYNPLRYPYKSVPYYRYEATYLKSQAPQYTPSPNAFFAPGGAYPDLNLPAPVVGCGSRREPCYGGTQEVIPNLMPPVDISENNIAPTTITRSYGDDGRSVALLNSISEITGSPVTTAVNISTRGPLGQPQQVGVLYKIFGDENEIHPLFGRRRYPNSDKWDYYTMMGKYGVKVPVKTHRRNEELGNNDEVQVQGLPGRYRVTLYESDFPQYIPYV